MANINGATLYESKQSQWGGQGSETRFPTDYLKAVNYALSEYSVALDLTTAVTHIDDPQDDIGVDASREWVLGLGIDAWLARIGNFRSGEITWESAHRDFVAALAIARVDRDRIAAAATTTAGDVIGLL